uniref:LAGLIDADG homing endonuclease n=1 Tax=Pappia fissilis TaxID=1040649 RepID=UPI002A82F621
WLFIAPDAYLIFFKFIFIMKECLDKIINVFFAPEIIEPGSFIILNYIAQITPVLHQASTSFGDSDITNSNISNSKKIRILAKDRIGPHNITILSILFGSLLGDCHAEYRNKGKGTRFCFYQESSHAAYLTWLHGLLSNLGYCNTKTPEIKTRLSKNGKVRKIIRFKTWTYSSFNWIHDLWYINNVKIVPSIIGDYLTPLALAIWIMDDGGKVGKGLKLSTNSFTYLDCTLLVKVLYVNFNIKSSIQSASVGPDNQYIIYIWKESIPLLKKIILPYVHPSMKYKLNI